jgi:hypothetical protein
VFSNFIYSNSAKLPEVPFGGCVRLLSGGGNFNLLCHNSNKWWNSNNVGLYEYLLILLRASILPNSKVGDL